MKHVYEWLVEPAQNKGEERAKRWLDQFTRPAYLKDYEWLDSYVLTCMYGGKKFRCIGASRMGDVWLTSKMLDTNGYEKRVDVTDCSDWELTKVL